MGGLSGNYLSIEGKFRLWEKLTRLEVWGIRQYITNAFWNWTFRGSRYPFDTYIRLCSLMTEIDPVGDRVFIDVPATITAVRGNFSGFHIFGGC